MRYFQEYFSNSMAGSGNQNCFRAENENEIVVSRSFYRLNAGGEYRYSLLFSNTVDSTFRDNAEFHANYVCDEWEILGARAGLTKTCDMESFVEPERFTELTFEGRALKRVMPGELFHCDPFLLRAEAGEYLCLELTFRGGCIPCLSENALPVFRQSGESWLPDNRAPLAAMIGCERKPRLAVGYLGDSITQGLGTPNNAYKGWSQQLAALLGDADYSHWNLGLGCGRGQDCARDGMWMFKARQMDAVFVCFGVNDIYRTADGNVIFDYIRKICLTLKAFGVRVFVQTPPPFDYGGELIRRWQIINERILTELAAEVDGVFDTRAVLSADPEHPERSKYGSHPDAVGCAAWARALLPQARRFLEKE